MVAHLPQHGNCEKKLHPIVRRFHLSSISRLLNFLRVKHSP